MSASSVAFVSCDVGGKTYTYHFTGVSSVEHSLSLTVGKEAKEGEDIVNGARNNPDQVTLSVVETDAEHSPGWAARMLEAMGTVKRRRLLCRVVTTMGSYTDMLLKEIRATQDEENQYGWSGELVFVRYVPVAGSGDAKENDNSSTRTNTGSRAPANTVTGTVFLQLLAEAGVSL